MHGVHLIQVRPKRMLDKHCSYACIYFDRSLQVNFPLNGYSEFFFISEFCGCNAKPTKSKHGDWWVSRPRSRYDAKRECM